MTIFVTWPQEIDDKFRSYYAELVQELIEDKPLNKGTHFFIGSSRITKEHIKVLSAAFPDLEFNEEQPAWADEVIDGTGI